MLQKEEKITLRGKSVLEDGKVIEEYSVEIDSTDPNNINFSQWQTDKAAYKANRITARADQAEFEDYAYVKQDEMIAGVE